MNIRVCLLTLASLGLLAPAMAQDEKKSDPAVAAIRQTGAQVLTLAQDDDRLDVAYHLGNVALTPEILGKLAAVKDRLYSLNLRGTNINDALAQHLAPLTALVRLHLEKTAITDAALPHLAGMQQLEYLNLYGTNITDAGLAHLHGLKNLKKVYVWQTKVTLEGVHALQKALPELEVIGGPPEPIVAVQAPHPKPQAAKPADTEKKPAKPEKKPAKPKKESPEAEKKPAKPEKPAAEPEKKSVKPAKEEK